MSFLYIVVTLNMMALCSSLCGIPIAMAREFPGAPAPSEQDPAAPVAAVVEIRSLTNSTERLTQAQTQFVLFTYDARKPPVVELNKARMPIERCRAPPVPTFPPTCARLIVFALGDEAATYVYTFSIDGVNSTEVEALKAVKDFSITYSGGNKIEIPVSSGVSVVSPATGLTDINNSPDLATIATEDGPGTSSTATLPCLADTNPSDPNVVFTLHILL